MLIKELSFNGSKLDGIGFVIEPNEAIDLLSKSPKNKDILYPFLGGADLNNQPDQKPTRWVINFSELPYEKAKEYPDCLQIVQERVYPSRQNHGEKRTRENWWQFTRVRNELYQSLHGLQKTIVISQATKYIQPSLVDTGIIFDQALVIFASQSYDLFAMLNSTIHSSWALEYQTSLGTTPYYIPTKAFLPFCFPQTLVTLDKIGKEYHEFRCQIMLSHVEGLTATYNRFHNPKENSTDIARLRELHMEIDNAVATAYGWSDLDLEHGFHETPQGVRFTISEAAQRQVLARLLQLNHERYEEEVRAGLHEKDKKKAKEEQPARQKPKKLAQPEGQMNLLAEPEVSDEVEAVEALPPTPTYEIGSWDRCKCLACGKTVMGFSIAEHTQSEHQGKDPGYRKM